MGITSCVYEEFSDENGEIIQISEDATLVIRLNTVNRFSTKAVEDKERINTIRIVITDNNDKVEINRLFTDVSDRDFYTDGIANEFIIPKVKPGENKNVYLFANEYCVTDIEWPLKGVFDIDNLHDLLEGATAQPDQFGTHMNTVYFSLKQENIDKFGLPYSASYHNLEVKEGERNEFKFYLVPAATKFRLNFYNYRNTSVLINDVGIYSLADRNYLMAHVGPTDYEKSLPGESEKKYWIDWLHEISEISWNYGEPNKNDWFNSSYGWITDYYLHEETSHSYQNKLLYYEYLNANTPSGNLKNPDVSYIGYFHESKNNGQNPYYNFYFQITYQSNNSSFETKDFNESLSDLYLFRNTFVDLDIILSEDQTNPIQVTYTVCPWFDKRTEITFE